jgi:hypothetical protein
MHPAARRPSLALLALVGVLGCGPTPDGTPRLVRVLPASAFYGSSERLQLQGRFAPDLSVDLGSDAAPTLENRFEVRIGPASAREVRFLARDLLEATVPATLPPGQHDLTVTDAQGHTATLPGGFVVRERDGARLTFVTSMRSAHPGEWSDSIRLELRDAEDQPAPTFAPRTLRITSDSDTGRFGRRDTDAPVPVLEVVLAPGDSGVDLLYQDATPGYHTLEATSLGLAPITQTVAVGRLGPPARVRFTQLPLAPLQAGEPVALAVEVLDASGGPAALPLTGVHLELSTDSPSGGLALGTDAPYHPALSVVLQAPQGRLPLLYRDTHGSVRVRLSARAINQDTLTPLAPDDQGFAVRPGPPHHLEVLRDASGPVRVGEPERFSLRVLDAWNNLTDHAGDVRVSTWPLTPDFSPGEARLEAGQGSLAARFAHVDEVALLVWDAHQPQVRGASTPLAPRPGPPARLVVTEPATSPRAGEPFLLTLEALDRFGNRADLPLSVTLAAPGVAKGALSPTTSGTFIGTTSLRVTVTAAVRETHLELETDEEEGTPLLGVHTGGFSVRPGPTRRFRVEPPAGTPTAGESFQVHVRALDEWGNTSEDVHDLTLGAEGLSEDVFSPARLGGFQGEADVAFTVTRADVPTRLTVESRGARGQQTSPFRVRAGEPTHFALTAPACVGTTDRWSLGVEARDAWDNRATAYTGTALLAVEPTGTASPGTSPTFRTGRADFQLTLGEVRAPLDCVRLSAVDTGPSGVRGTSACVAVHPHCP